MLNTPKDVQRLYPLRPEKQGKQQFREEILRYAAAGEIPASVETGFGCRNVVLGDPEAAGCVITARYDAPFQKNEANTVAGVMTILEILRTLPENSREKVCFVLLEEGITGNRGAKAYRNAHKEATDRQMVICLTAVARGSSLQMIPTPALKENRRRLTSLYKACGYFGKRSLTVLETKKGRKRTYRSPFPWAVSVAAAPEKAALREKHPVSPDETNINILRAALTTFVCCGAAQ